MSFHQNIIYDKNSITTAEMIYLERALIKSMENLIHLGIATNLDDFVSHIGINKDENQRYLERC